MDPPNRNELKKTEELLEEFGAEYKSTLKQQVMVQYKVLFADFLQARGYPVNFSGS